MRLAGVQLPFPARSLASRTHVSMSHTVIWSMIIWSMMNWNMMNWNMVIAGMLAQITHKALLGVMLVVPCRLNAAEMFVDVSQEGASTSTNWVAESGVLDLFFLLGPSPRQVCPCSASSPRKLCRPSKARLAIHMPAHVGGCRSCSRLFLEHYS